MTNKYTGEETISLGGSDYTLIYDWTALGRMKSELAGPALASALSGTDPANLAAVLLIGLARHHSDITVQQIIEWSPPLMPTVKAIERALNYAYWGPEGEPKAAKENPPKRTATK